MKRQYIDLGIGHAEVKQYLNRIGRTDSPLSDHCRAQVEETIHHYILECPAFDMQRNFMYTKLQNLHIGNINLKVLLGGEKKYQRQRTVILLVLMQFIVSTNRLSEI